MPASLKVTLTLSTINPDNQYIVVENPLGEFTKYKSNVPPFSTSTTAFDIPITDTPGIYKVNHFEGDPGDVTVPGYQVPENIPLPELNTRPATSRTQIMEFSSGDIALNKSRIARFLYVSVAPIEPIDCSVLGENERYHSSLLAPDIRISDVTTGATRIPVPPIRRPGSLVIDYNPFDQLFYGVRSHGGAEKKFTVFGSNYTGGVINTNGVAAYAVEVSQHTNAADAMLVRTSHVTEDGFMYTQITDEVGGIGHAIGKIYVGDVTSKRYGNFIEMDSTTELDIYNTGILPEKVIDLKSEGFFQDGYMYYTDELPSILRVEIPSGKTDQRYLKLPDGYVPAATFFPGALTIQDGVVYAWYRDIPSTAFKFDLPTDWESPEAIDLEIVDLDVDNVQAFADCKTAKIPPANLDGSVKTVSNQAPEVGDVITYTVVISNSGTLDSTAVFLKDVLATGLSFAGNVTGGTGDPTDGTGIDVGTVAAGASVTVTFDVNVDAVPDPNPFTNTAVLEYDNGDGLGLVTANDIVGQPIDVPIPPIAVLGTSPKTVSNPTPFVGDVVTYTIDVVNSGAVEATAVFLKDVLATGLSFAGNVTGGTGDPTDGTGIDVGTVPAGGNVVVTFDVNVDAIPDPNPYVNTATFEFNDGTGPATTDVTGGEINASQKPIADLGNSTKFVSNANPKVGDTVTYTISLVNSGTLTATGVTVTDVLTTGIEFVNGSVLINGVASADSPITGIAIADIAPLNAVIVTFQALITAIPTPNPYINIADLGYDDGNGNPVVDKVTGGEINATLPAGPSLGGTTKSVDNATPTEGETIKYTIALVNSGDQIATNVIVKDSLPTGLTYVSGSAIIGTQPIGGDPNTTGFFVGIIGVGATASLEFDVIVNSVPTPNPFLNSADLSYENPVTGAAITDTITGGEIDVQAGTGANLGNATKTASSTSATVGDTVTYSINLENTGAKTATNITVTDVLPTGLDYVTGTSKIDGVVVADGPSTGITVATLAVNAKAVVTFDVLLSALPTPNPYANTANIAYDDGNGNRPTLPVTGEPLTINPDGGDGGSNLGNSSKFVDNGNPAIGETVTYTIEIPNSGTETAQSVTVLDKLPTALSLVGTPVVTGNVGTVTGSITVAPGLNIGSIVAGGTATITLQVKIDSLPTPNPYENTATITYTDSTGTTTFPTTGGNLNVGGTNGADLGGAKKKADNNSPEVGEGVIYTVTIPNQGPATAENVIVYDALTANVELVEIISVTGNTGVVTGDLDELPGLAIGDIAVGATAVIKFRVAVKGIPTPNPFNNVVKITYTDQTGTKTGNVSGGNLDVVATDGSNLSSATKDGDKTSAKVGEKIKYTVTIPNNGALSAEQVTVLDELPSELTLVAGSVVVTGASGPNVGSITTAPGLNIGTISAGATATVVFEILINAIPTPAEFKNEAIITYTDETGKPGVTITPPTVVPIAPNGGPDLTTSTKSADKAKAVLGEIIVYTVSVKNTGDEPASEAVLTDILPSGLTYVANSATVKNVLVAVTDNIKIPVGDIAVNETVEVKFSVEVTGVITPSQFKNTAIVDYKTPTGESGSVTITDGDGVDVSTGFIAPDGAVKESDKTAAAVGEEITYTITVKNDGTSAITNAVVFDVPPVGTEFVAGSVTINGVSQPSLSPIGGLALPSVSANSTTVVTLKVKVLESTTTEIVNQANVTYSGGPTGPVITVPTNPNVVDKVDAKLTMTKSANRTGAIVGDVISYTIKIENTGSLAVSNVIVKDNLSSALEFVSGSVKIDGVANSGNIESGINIGTVQIGAVVMVTFESLVMSLADGGEAVTNKVDATYNYQKTPTSPVETGTDESNENSVEGFDTNMETSKNVSKEAVKIGEEFSYTVKIKNNGTIDAEKVKIVDPLPQAFEVKSVVVDGNVVAGDIRTGIILGELKQNESLEIVINVVLTEKLETAFINELEATYYFKADPTQPESEQMENIVDEGAEGRDPTKPYPGLVTSNAKIKMEKRTNKTHVAVGEIIDYFIDIENVGNVTAKNVTLVDLLSESLEFVEGSFAIDGTIQIDASVLTGVNLGDIEKDEKMTVSFKAKVLSDGVITNQAVVEYVFETDGKVEAGKDVSNVNEINSSEVKLIVKKETDMNFIVLEDVIPYTITITNETDSIATNILLQDDLPRYLKLVEGSFMVDGKVVNNVNLEKGVNVGEVKPNETMVINYSAVVVSSACGGVVKNSVELKYSYILPDGSVGVEHLEPTGEAISIVEMGMSNFKQFSIESYLQIPEVKPDVESINMATGTIDIKNCHVIKTPINRSMENQRITGYKLIVHGVLNLVIEYTALETTQSVHSAHYSIPFSTFVVLPEDYVVGSKLDVEGIVEDIYYKSTDIRNFFQNTTALINVKLLMC